MERLPLIFFAIISFLSSTRAEETRVATAALIGEKITGSVTFTEVAEGINVKGTIVGLPAGKYGFHIHELGDIGISNCDAAGAHYDLGGNKHGGPDHNVRHVGDLGNVEFVKKADSDETEAKIDFVDKVIALRGDNNILGRTVVLHAQEDDLGLGQHADSQTTGNAGARVACGVIGVKSPAGPWNVAVSFGPSSALLVLALIFFIWKY